MLIINKDKFSIDCRNEIVDEDGNIKFWCQPDFAFKKRLHVYDENNNEIGYVQYKILKSQEAVEYYDHNNNKLDFSDYQVVGDNWNIEITHNSAVVLKSEVNGENAIVDIKDNLNLLIPFGLIK